MTVSKCASKNLMRTGTGCGRPRLVAADALPSWSPRCSTRRCPPFPPGRTCAIPRTVAAPANDRLRRGRVALAMVDLVPPGLVEELAPRRCAPARTCMGDRARKHGDGGHRAGSMRCCANRREVLGVQRLLVRRPTDPSALPATPLASGGPAWLHGMRCSGPARAVRAQALETVAAEFRSRRSCWRCARPGGQLTGSVPAAGRGVTRGARGRGGVPWPTASSGCAARTAEPGVFVPEPGPGTPGFAVHRPWSHADTELGLIRPVR